MVARKGGMTAACSADVKDVRMVVSRDGWWVVERADSMDERWGRSMVGHLVFSTVALMDAWMDATMAVLSDDEKVVTMVPMMVENLVAC